MSEDHRAFRDFAVLQRGFDLPVQDRTDGDIPVVASNGVVGWHSDAKVRGPGVVTGRSGTIGKVMVLQGDFWPLNTTLYVKDFKGNIPQYVGLVLETMNLPAHAGGSTVPSLNRNVLDEVPVFCPPIPVQRRIVDLMTHLDSHLANLRAERDACSRSASVLRREMFSNLSRGTVRASEMFDMLLGRQKSARQSVGEYVLPYLRAANIGEHGLKLDDVQTMNFDPAEQAKYGLLEDDILLVEGGSVGLAARWKGQISGVVGFDKHVIRLRARGGESISEYGLQWAHWCRESGAFDEQATGITIRALGFGRASAMSVPNLSIEEQEEFCAPLAAAAALVARQQAEVDRLVSLRASLLSLLLSAAIDLPVDYDALLSKVA